MLDDYRRQNIWTLEIDDILKTNMDGVQKLFRYYFHPNKKWFDIKDAIMLICKDGMFVQTLEKEVVQCFGLSKMTIVNEFESRALYKKLLFPEFLDFLVRVADIVFKTTDYEAAILPRKLERLLDRLFQLVKVSRKEVNIEDLLVCEDSDEGAPEETLEL